MSSEIPGDRPSDFSQPRPPDGAGYGTDDEATAGSQSSRELAPAALARFSEDSTAR